LNVNNQTQKLSLQGPAGRIELSRDEPQGGSTRGTAIIAHPHPLFGGTMDNKVVQTMARAFVQSGYAALRFNFRGVGASEGAHDEGRGETQDLLHIAAQLVPSGALCVAGFSFGAYVATHALAQLGSRHSDIQRVVLVGTSTQRAQAAPIAGALHERTLVVHGEADDTVPLASVMDWARPQLLPVTVVPAGGHFFHGQLPLLKSLVLRHLGS
jgi:uncharacterized protein